MAELKKTFNRSNWLSILMAVIVFYVSLGNSFTPIDKSELTVISVVVKDEINANLGRRSDFGASSDRDWET